MTHELLAKVGRSSAQPCYGELVFREYQAGRISKDEYDTRNAIWVGENAHEYHFRRYPTLSPDLVNYARARVNNVREDRGESENHRIGIWVQTVMSLAQQNDADHGLLVWCLERVQAKRLTKHAEMLVTRLKVFDQPPPEHLEIALASQRKDAEAKQREQRRPS